MKIKIYVFYIMTEPEALTEPTIFIQLVDGGSIRDDNTATYPFKFLSIPMFQKPCFQ